MCGFTAIKSIGGSGQSNRAMVEAMTAQIVHRGPDDSGFFVDEEVALGFRRLSILDLQQTGHQPMFSDDERYVIVYNGEIYNYIEIRKELDARNHTFRSTGDTEVVLNAYREWGKDCLSRFNGMWAFLIFDRETRTLFGSRDRFGVKPLYYARSQEHLLFGSEIKAIIASGKLERQVNWGTAARFFVEKRLDDTSETFFANVHQVPPGTAFEVPPDGDMRTWEYWRLEATWPAAGTSSTEAFASLFEDAVQLRLRSDVPIGVSLSGGLDSTSILCSLGRHKTDEAEATLAFWFNSQEFDETRYVEQTIQRTRVELFKMESGPEALWESLTDVLRFHDEPIHSMTALVGFHIMRLAHQQGVKVILNGQGADETLAGYDSYFTNYWHGLLRSQKIRGLWQELDEFVAAHGGSQWDLFQGQIVSLAKMVLSHSSAYRALAQARKRRELSGDKWFTPSFKALVEIEDPGPSDLSLQTALTRSIEKNPLPLYLRIEDRNSMAHSVEVRLPFLDYRLVQLAMGLADDERMRGPWNKWILRESMKERIPEVVRTRVDKFGFPVPTDRWLRGPLGDQLTEILGSQAMRERGIYNTDVVLADLERHKKGEINIGAKLFDVAQFELWWQHCLGDAGSTPAHQFATASRPRDTAP